MKQFICLVVVGSCLLQHVSAHGKEEQHVPHLGAPPAPKPTVAPEEVVQEVATCYQGYTLMSDGTCVKEITEEPLPAEGDVTVPYMSRCPAGFLPRNGQCIKTRDVPLAYFCPVGFEDDGTSCVQTTPGEVVTSCNEGELINNVCVMKERAPHIITPKCPEGSEVEKDGNCWRVVETFDCTPKTGKEEVTGRVIGGPKQRYPLGKKIVVSKGKETANLRALHPQKEYTTESPATLPYTHPSKHSIHGKLVTGKEETTTPLPPVAAQPTACPSKELVSVSPPHPTKISPVSQTCAKKEIVEAIAVISCPEGFEDFGEACGKETTTPPVSLCLSNGSTEGACPPYVRRVAKILQCSNGKSPEKGKCVEIETAPAENLCAEGFKDTGNGCTGRVKSGGPECRPGLTLMGNKCVGKSKRPSVAVTLRAKPGCENKY